MLPWTSTFTIATWCIAVFFIYTTAVLAIETIEDAAIIARRLVDSSKNSIGTMATVYPADDTNLPGHPFSMQEYYASCHQNGSLTLLFLPISRHSRNILRAPGQAASISVTADFPAARKPRVALMGNITIYKDGPSTVPDVESLRRCYLEKHPDARWWLPDDEDGAHISHWARFDPHTIYFVGGFGGIHYIGYIPLQLYQAASEFIGTNSEVREYGNVFVKQ